MERERIVDEAQQLALFNSIIKELDNHGSLKDMVLIGGWALKMYHHHYGAETIPLKKTTDADFLFRRPPEKIEGSFNLDDYLKQQGFTEERTLLTQETCYQHKLLDIDFLIAQTGSADRNDPVKIPGYDVNATQLRYLDVAAKFTIRVNYDGAQISVPHPATYTYLKYIVGDLPARSHEKAEKDIDTANKMSVFLAADGDMMGALHCMMTECPAALNAKFYASAEKYNHPFADKVRDFRAQQFVLKYMTENETAPEHRGNLLLAEKNLGYLGCEKYRDAVFGKTVEGLPPSKIPYFVNHYLAKGKGDTPVKEILKTRERDRDR